MVSALSGGEVLYNTYWVRFNHLDFTHSTAVDNTLKLFAAAKEAGIRRIVHVSINQPVGGQRAGVLQRQGTPGARAQGIGTVALDPPPHRSLRQRGHPREQHRLGAQKDPGVRRVRRTAGTACSPSSWMIWRSWPCPRAGPIGTGPSMRSAPRRSRFASWSPRWGRSSGNDDRSSECLRGSGTSRHRSSARSSADVLPHTGGDRRPHAGPPVYRLRARRENEADRLGARTMRASLESNTLASSRVAEIAGEPTGTSEKHVPGLRVSVRLRRCAVVGGFCAFFRSTPPPSGRSRTPTR